jgi:hypothetical protein
MFSRLSDGQISYSFTRIVGAHKLTAGASFDHILLDETGDLDRAGYYQFTSLQNFLAAQPSKLSILAPELGHAPALAHAAVLRIRAGRCPHQPPS